MICKLTSSILLLNTHLALAESGGHHLYRGVNGEHSWRAWLTIGSMLGLDVLEFVIGCRQLWQHPTARAAAIAWISAVYESDAAKEAAMQNVDPSHGGQESGVATQVGNSSNSPDTSSPADHSAGARVASTNVDDDIGEDEKGVSSRAVGDVSIDLKATSLVRPSGLSSGSSFLQSCVLSPISPQIP